VRRAGATVLLMKILRALGELFGLRRNLVILLIVIFAIGAGEELWMRFIPKYLQALGATIFVIGAFDAIRTLLGAIYAYPGGLVVDHWGFRRAFIAFNVLSIVGYAIVLLVPHWGAVFCAMFLFLSWTCFSLPATFSLVAETLEANRRSMGIGMQSVIKRLPIMVAPFLGGVLIDRFGMLSGVRIGLAASIVISSGTIAVQWQVRETGSAAIAKAERWTFWRSLTNFNAPLRRLLCSDILIRFCERIPFAWVVIYAMDNVGIDAKQVGFLVTIEVLAATACIIPASYFADKYGREPFVFVTFIMFTLFPITLWLSRNLAMLIAAFAIRGLKEFGDTSRKALIIGYSDPRRRGQTIGAYYLVRDLLVTSGALLGALLWKIGPGVNFAAASALGALGTVYYLITLRRAGGGATPAPAENSGA
jgi:MFS family permease